SRSTSRRRSRASLSIRPRRSFSARATRAGFVSRCTTGSGSASSTPTLRFARAPGRPTNRSSSRFVTRSARGTPAATGLAPAPAGATTSPSSRSTRASSRPSISAASTCRRWLQPASSRSCAKVRWRARRGCSSRRGRRSVPRSSERNRLEHALELFRIAVAAEADEQEAEARQCERPRLDRYRALAVVAVRDLADAALGRLLAADVERDAIAEIRDRVGSECGRLVDARTVAQRGQCLVELGYRAAHEPADVHARDEVDDWIVVAHCEASTLDVEPALARDAADRIVVELAVAAVVQGDAADERLARQRHVLPEERELTRERRVVHLREDDVSPLRPEHRAPG